jgi:hypothetical protein
MTSLLFSSLMAMLLLSLAAARAQPGNFDAIGDATDAMSDALLATPNRKTPVPDANLSATAPGVQQATPHGSGTSNNCKGDPPGIHQCASTRLP